MRNLVENAAEEVLRDLNLWRLPVDPFRIVREEGIHLGLGSYGRRFDARIEYYPIYDSFGIYYKEPGPYRPEGRVRFSIAHELGHFYLPEHRKRIKSGDVHNSITDYGSKDPFESEADRFAASLLMPKELFIEGVRNFRGGFCTLEDLCTLAERLGTSVTSTAIRYCDCDLEPTTIIISRERTVLWSWASTDMRLLNMSFVKSGSPIPRGTKTADLYAKREHGEDDEYVEGRISSSIWFDRPRHNEVWEEAKFLGDRVLTYLAATDA
jgi:Zn-dependent peptidase ImmA (M78 family)